MPSSYAHSDATVFINSSVAAAFCCSILATSQISISPVIFWSDGCYTVSWYCTSEDACPAWTYLNPTLTRWPVGPIRNANGPSPAHSSQTLAGNNVLDPPAPSRSRLVEDALTQELLMSTWRLLQTSGFVIFPFKRLEWWCSRNYLNTESSVTTHSLGTKNEREGVSFHA